MVVQLDWIPRRPHTVRELETPGLIIRRSDPNDARRALVELTDVGDPTLRQLDAVMAEVQDEVFTALTAAQRRTLVELLQKVS